MESIFEGLNEAQKAAVEYCEGPSLIIAGAGSGKTRVLTCKIAYLLQQGVDPGRILALTFTRKAANEMIERIASIVGSRTARHLQMGTFHSILIRLLRDYAEFLGYTREFTIADTNISTSTIKAIIKDFELNDKVYKPKEVFSRISFAKTNSITAEVYANTQEILQNDARRHVPEIARIYKEYAKRMKTSNIMDFDDILLNMAIILRDSPTALEELSGRFDYILVDEYQDTNSVQYYIIRRLSQGHKNISVVGDDSQSIYAFRGAQVKNIIDFRKDFPSCRVFRLERNYRSTKTIVEAANSLIAHNSNRIPKECFSDGEEGEKIKLIGAYSEDDEAFQIVSDIVTKISERSYQYSDFAILYRTNAQSRALEQALRTRNIPYLVFKGRSFFDHAEVQDMMSYFRLVINNCDDESFKRICNKPTRKIGQTSLASLMAAARSQGGIPLFKAALLPDEILEQNGLKGAAISSIRSFCALIASFAAKLHSEDAYDLGVRIANESLYYDSLKQDNSVEGLARLANVEELLNSIKSFSDDKKREFYELYLADNDSAATAGEAKVQIAETDLSNVEIPVITLNEFIENIMLLTSVDVDDEDSNKVTLMTVHSAKGLEFKHVTVSGLEDNLFPSGGFLASPADIEEERRLMYVAMTRAMNTLVLTFASNRMRNGLREDSQPSRFITEIDKNYILNPLKKSSSIFGDSETKTATSSGNQFGKTSGSQFGKITQASSERNLRPITQGNMPGRPLIPKDRIYAPSAAISSLVVGARVRHSKFGDGTITAIEQGKATVNFDDCGSKVLLLQYAKLEVI
ncbi:MAG: UvrD-helicase domain-containing protein [Bacteroidales bacterium]|nr:UvrD-helicase domain-containing protein [Bacteroidales bacterium]